MHRADLSCVEWRWRRLQWFYVNISCVAERRDGANTWEAVMRPSTATPCGDKDSARRERPWRGVSVELSSSSHGLPLILPSSILSFLPPSLPPFPPSPLLFTTTAVATGFSRTSQRRPSYLAAFFER
ncbi:hypothetical protein E2C01_047363 [Portunus trituberculatus]|uniref:Uncharacterized protein n=1 Tax=Portunus trituberculatus TaxID=210409 RepID=A0A5B7G790_PORTR|nr:hypothetical protein [Portunus trituberculatus]